MVVRVELVLHAAAPTLLAPPRFQSRRSLRRSPTQRRLRRRACRPATMARWLLGRSRRVGAVCPRAVCLGAVCLGGVSSPGGISWLGRFSCVGEVSCLGQTCLGQVSYLGSTMRRRIAGNGPPPLRVYYPPLHRE